MQAVIAVGLPVLPRCGQPGRVCAREVIRSGVGPDDVDSGIGLLEVDERVEQALRDDRLVLLFVCQPLSGPRVRVLTWIVAAVVNRQG
jgi:hypothetical protein